MADVDRFDSHDIKTASRQKNLSGRERITCTPAIVSLIVKALTVKLVCPRLCYSINNAAGGTAIFGRIVGGVHLKLAHRSLADYVADARATTLFREECLIVIATINRVVIQHSGNSTEADQAKRAVKRRTRSQQREVGPAPAVDWQLVNRSLIDVTREVLLGGVDNR